MKHSLLLIGVFSTLLALLSACSAFQRGPSVEELCRDDWQGAGYASMGECIELSYLRLEHEQRRTQAMSEAFIDAGNYFNGLSRRQRPNNVRMPVQCNSRPALHRSGGINTTCY